MHQEKIKVESRGESESDKKKCVAGPFCIFSVCRLDDSDCPTLGKT